MNRTKPYVRRLDERFDGFSIGSSDLTQVVLDVSRGARTVGICGEAPSTDPDFAAFLVAAGIDSISFAPDSVLRTIETVARAEHTRG